MKSRGQLTIRQGCHRGWREIQVSVEQNFLYMKFVYKNFVCRKRSLGTGQWKQRRDLLKCSKAVGGYVFDL